MPWFLRSVWALLAIAMVAVFGRMYFFDRSFLDLHDETLFAFGALFPGAEPWRAATSLFVHKGLWHLALCVVPLLFVGTELEELFGRGRTLALCFLVGVGANLLSLWVGPRGIGAGSSGAIMGLVGLAAAWGHRDGTVVGRRVRNRMLKWVAYLVLFGLLVGADRIAHLAAFAGGALLGGLVSPRWWEGRSAVRDAFAGWIAGVACMATFALCLSFRAPEAADDPTPQMCRNRPAD